MGMILKICEGKRKVLKLVHNTELKSVLGKPRTEGGK